ncbi:hypothetical protein ACFY4K_30990 [Streptomyces leeuwenhoekii]|uniref:hypothetical protein n=1 Tax=Streptomyces leeuwenhoekii TaxID=1437453 RepID=UPI0036A42B3A
MAGFIDEMLREDAQAPRKQRDTIDRIVQRLAAEQGFEQAGCPPSISGMTILSPQ